MSDLVQDHGAPGPVPGAPAGAPAIALRGVSKWYGAHRALNDVTLDVPAGSVCGLIGPNGAGKSTLMAIVATLLRQSTGEVEVLGTPLRDVAAVRSLIGYVPDVLGTYSGITVEEYLRFFADAYRIDASRRDALIDGLLELVDLTEKRAAEVNSLSRGMKQRIGLARSLVHEPRLLILDEPASGLDPRARIELRDIIAHLNSLGVTILISSHILGELEEMCTHAAVIEQGHLVGFEHLGDEPVRTVLVRFVDGPDEVHTVADDAAQVELLRAMVHAGRAVLTVETERTGLEERFMRLTEGRTN